MDRKPIDFAVLFSISFIVVVLFSTMLQAVTLTQTNNFSVYLHGGSGGLGYTSLNLINLSNANITNASLTGYACSGSNCNFTVALDSQNYTSINSFFNITDFTNVSVFYNASDGSWRNISELGSIGQGYWNLNNNSGNYSVNYTLAGADGMDYGIRDTQPRGSYWATSAGSVYGKINISNDFVTASMDTSSIRIFNSTNGLIFNSTWNSILLDNSGLNSTYNLGSTQNATVYFFDWANQTWKVWMNGTGNSSAGMPNWLDPRYKQEFKWRYAFSAAGYPSVNYTFLMTAQDPFVRIFTDTYGGDNSNVGTGNLVAWWKLDEGSGQTIADSSGYGSSGTLGNTSAIEPTYDPTWSSNCRFGNCLSFNGVYNFVNITPSVTLQQANSSLTVEAWVKPSVTCVPVCTAQLLVSSGYTSPSYYLDIDGNGKADFEFNGAGCNPTIEGTTILAGGTWYHLVGVRNPTTTQLEIWVNGVREGTTTDTCGTVNSTKNFLLGVLRSSDLFFPFNGIIDNVKIFNRALAGSEIQAEYSSMHNLTIPVSLGENRTSLTTAEPGLVGYWNFNEGSGASAYDSSGNGNHGTITGTANWTSGRFGSALSFDGSTNYVTTSSFSVASPKITWAVWLRINAFPASSAKYAMYVHTANYRDIWFSLATDSTLSFDIYDTSGTQHTTTSSALSTGVWYFVVGTYDGNTQNLYINGTLVATNAWSGSFSFNDVLYIGSSFDTTQKFNGIIDEARIYNRALSASEIQQLYQTGLDQQKPGIYFTTNGGRNEEALFAATNERNVYRNNNPSASLVQSNGASSGCSPTNIAYPNAVIAGNLLVVSYNGQAVSSITDTLGNTWKQDVKNEASGTNAYVYHAIAKSSGSDTVTISTSPSCDHVYAGIWHFDEGAGANVTDASGNGNNGALINSPAWVTGKYGTALNFTIASGSYVSIGTNNLPTGSSAASICAWVDWAGSTVQASGQHTFIYLGGTVGGGEYSGLGVYSDGTNEHLLYDNGGGGDFISSLILPLNTPHFICGTYASGSSQATLYLDGSQSQTGSIGSPGAPNNVVFGSAAIGADVNFGCSDCDQFPGWIDEVHIYNRVLTSQEIWEMYAKQASLYYDDFGTAASGKTYRYFGVEDSNTSMEPITPAGTVLHLRFNDNSTANVTDSSGYGNNGYSNATWLTNSSCKANLGGCIDFSGNGQYLDLGNSSSLNPVSITIAGWVNYRLQLNGNTGILSKECYGPLNSHCSGQVQGYAIYVPNSTSISILTGNGTGNAQCITTYYGIVSGQWYHFAGTFDNSTNTQTLYINGTKVQSTNCPGGLAADSGTLDIGVRNYDTQSCCTAPYFNGTVGDILIINRSLSSDEVYQLYLGGYNRTIGNHTHRVASVDGVYSAAYNLSAHDPSVLQDYDQRNLLITETQALLTQPPQYSNVGSNASVITPVTSNLLYSYWTSGANLSYAVLSTNESGTWKNYTDGTYSSPKNIANTNASWANFTWQNSSVPVGTTVGWQTYANDTNGNWNVTPIQTFSVQVSTTCYIITGNAYDYFTGLPINSGTVTAISKETGEESSTTFTNGIYSICLHSSIDITKNSFTVSIVANTTDNRIGWGTAIIGGGPLFSQTQTCSIRQTHFRGVALSTSGTISQGNVQVSMNTERGPYTNSTTFSNGYWDIYISPCLILGGIYTFNFAISGQGMSSSLSIQQVAR